MMKLSEAIRLGALAIPQTCLYNGCAIGTALFAVGRNWHYNKAIAPASALEKAIKLWPFLTTLEVPSPPGGIYRPYPCSVFVIIEDLNGVTTLRWTRERIADWVEGIEKEYDVYHEENILCQQTVT